LFDHKFTFLSKAILGRDIQKLGLDQQALLLQTLLLAADLFGLF